MNVLSLKSDFWWIDWLLLGVLYIMLIKYIQLGDIAN